MVDEKPGLMELMGIAVNATNLATVEGREGSVERLAAMGMAQTNPGAEEHDARDVEEIDADAALGALLIRIKGGRRSGLHSVPMKEALKAVDMLTHWVRQQPTFARWKLRGGTGMLQNFIRQSLAEWLSDVCLKCNGVEWTGVERDKLVHTRPRCKPCKGTGTVMRQAKKARGHDGKPIQLRAMCSSCRGMGAVLRETLVPYSPDLCSGCRGTGRRLANDAERARVLGVSTKTYDQYWLRRFDWLRARLDHVDWYEKNLLQVQLERGINRPVQR